MHEFIRCGVPLGLTLVAVFTDLRRREVPDVVPLSLLVWALIACATGLSSLSWLALIGGALLGLTAAGVFFTLGGLGGGDVKLIAALGAILGPVGLVQVLFWMALAGGALALASAARGRKELAYVPAIAAGLTMQTFWPEALPRAIASLQ
jgi:prepilin peptidase CpaA